jgi:hypothetical protein
MELALNTRTEKNHEEYHSDSRVADASTSEPTCLAA